MRSVAVLAAITLVALSCGGTSSTGHSPTPTHSAGASASPSASPGATSYGLLLSAGTLEMITPAGTVAAHATVAPPSVNTCGQGMGAVLQPPVSATMDKVFFRDGNTSIRYLTPDGQTGNATTVPGGASKISFFSVSPDDQRIAVVVVDLMGSAAIGLRLYVEDLHGGGHHADIYTTTTPKGQGGTTLWPMGWHQGRLVLAVWAACTFEQVPYPSAWHVADASTAVRLAAMGDARCLPSVWPSPAGVACFDPVAGKVKVFDWTGKLAITLPTQIGATEVSPSGLLLAAGNGGGYGNQSPTTTMIGVDGSGSVTSPGHMGCLWIDDGHVLARDAVIDYPSGAVTSVAQSGVCAGRFPGGL